MSLTLRIVLTVLSVLTFIACIVVGIVGITASSPLLAIVGFAMSPAFGYFIYNDVKYYLSLANAQPPAPPAS